MRQLVLLLFFLIFLGGCAAPPETSWTRLPSATELLGLIKSRQDTVVSLDGSAKVGLQVKEKYNSSQQFILLEKPNRIRADVLTGFGQLVLQLASNGEDLSVFLNTSVPGRFFQGPASAGNLSRFTRIPVEAEDMVSLLLYDPPLIDYKTAEVEQQGGSLLLRLTGADMQQELLFDGQLLLTGCRYVSVGNAFLEVYYGKHLKEKGFPRSIKVTVPAEETTVTLKFSEVLTNVAIDTKRFLLPQPENIPVEVLP